MKRCYNYGIFWISFFAILLLIVVALQPYKTEGFSTLDGEDLNNHSCPKLMNNSAYLKNHYKNFNDNAKMIASFMEPGLSEEYMETESKKHLKGMCIIPDDKIVSYNLFVQEDPVKGGPSQVCKANLTNKITNEVTEVVMPYVNNVNKGCALVFSDYGNDPKKVETLLNNLDQLSNEYNEQVKAKNIELKNTKQNEYNSFENANRQIQSEEQKFKTMNDALLPELQETQNQFNMKNAVYNQQKQQNMYYKNKLTPTW